MKKTNFSTRAYVMKNGQVMIRVRWNSKKNEVGFSIGYTIDPLKWDSDKQLVKSNTTHKIGGKIVYAREINNATVVSWSASKKCLLNMIFIPKYQRQLT